MVPKFYMNFEIVSIRGDGGRGNRGGRGDGRVERGGRGDGGRGNRGGRGDGRVERGGRGDGGRGNRKRLTNGGGRGDGGPKLAHMTLYYELKSKMITLRKTNNRNAKSPKHPIPKCLGKRILLVRSGEIRHHISLLCCLCNKKFYINNGGKSQVKAHSETKTHKERQSIASQDSGQSILTVGENNNIVVAPSKLNLTIDDLALKAEIIWALKCCKNNFSFKSNDDTNEIFKEMFPDSKIAAQYSMSVTKTRYLIQFGIAPLVLETLKEDIKQTPITFQFDETTTSQVKKQYDGLIRYNSKIHKRVVTHYCGSLFVGHCDAQHLRQHFFDFGKKLNWNVDYVLHLMMDGPNVNKKFHRELEEDLKQLYGKYILKTSTCSLHPIHTAFKKGLSKIAFDYDKFSQDLHFFFKHSAARREDYNFVNLESDIEAHVMLRHVSSRWLSLKKALVRILEQWANLKRYFLTFLPTTTGFRSKIESTARYDSKFLHF
ncbi:hypothetical protein HA402_003328 [Bradysia odoriphaga]|nr:hypothetical protein HA402_003328 [Bradysia odoriphaga]